VVASAPNVTTGNAEYDRYFAEVGELWRSLEAAEHELPEAQAALARRVGLPEGAGADVLGARLRERTAHLALEGLTLELEFAGIEAADGVEEAVASEEPASANAIPSQPPAMPTATLRTPGREPERRELRLLEVVAQAALSAATVYAEMGTLPRRTHPLAERATALRGQVDQAFAEPSQRARVQSELAQTEALLGKLNERGRALANAADTLVSLLDEAANTANPGPARRRPATPRDPANKPAVLHDPAAPAERPARAAPPKPQATTDAARDFEP
jgi:hypothetical protein